MGVDFAEELMRLADRRRVPRLPEPFALDFYELCVLHDEDPVAIAAELATASALTRLLRKAVGLDLSSFPAPKRGRPSKIADHQRDRYVVKALQYVAGMTLEEAFETAAEIRSEEGRRGKDGQPITAAGIRSAVNRLTNAKNFGWMFEGATPKVDALQLYLRRSKYN